MSSSSSTKLLTLTLTFGLGATLQALQAQEAATPAAPATPAAGQAAEAPPQEEHTVEEIQAAIAGISGRIASREERVSRLGQQIVELDEHVEKGVDRIMDLTKSVGDSLDSNTRVTQMKSDIIDGLRRSIQVYAQKRSQIRQDVVSNRQPFSQDEVKDDLGVLDSKIDKRVEQIIEMSKTLQEHKDFPKYVGNSGYGWRGWGTVQRNPKHQQNRSATVLTDKERRGLADALRENIADLESQNRDLERRLESPNFANQYDLMKEDLERNKQVIEARQTQLDQLLSPAKPKTSPVSGRQALEIEGTVHDIADDIRRDFDSIFRLYHEFAQEREALAHYRAQMDALERMLEEAEAKASQ